MNPSTSLADSRFDAVLFDLDGTLIDSTAAVERCWRRWAHEFGIDGVFRQVPHGLPARSIVAHLVSPEKVEVALARIGELESADTAGIRALPGAVRILKSIPNRNKALVTSCDRRLARIRMSAAGLPSFSTQITADDIARGKPAPDPYLAAATILGCNPQRCLAFEDAPAGIAAASAAGCTVLAVVGSHAVADLTAAHYHIDSLEQVHLHVNEDGVKVVLPPHQL